MSFSVASDTLQVVGLGLAGPATRGPALLGGTDWSVLLAVSAADGAPVAGLTRESFSVAALVTRRGGASAVALDPVSVDEPMAGVYGLHFSSEVTGRLMSIRLPCVVDVRAQRNHGELRGRTLVQLAT
jgi:hypothetical protein